MNTSFIMTPESVAIVEADTKQGILEEMSRLFAESWRLDPARVLEAIEEREKLGSTGFGRGVAIPHARYSGLHRPIAALLKLKRPVDFDAADGMLVDLVFGLLSPEDSGAMHLHALAELSRMVRDDRVHEALSEATDAEAIYGLLTNAMDRDAA